MKTKSPGPSLVRAVVISVLVFSGLVVATVVFFLNHPGAVTALRPVETEKPAPAQAQAIPHYDAPDQPASPPLVVISDQELNQRLPGIHPPLPSADILPVVQRVKAAAGTEIKTGHSSRIVVPAYAFLDKDGNVVEGDVDLTYREFHNTTDIFVSGIPMKYDSGSPGGMLESAGMIELNASQDGKPVFVNPSSQIKILLASAQDDPSYGLYFYNTRQNKWVYKGKDEVVTDNLANELHALVPKVKAPVFTPPERVNGFYVRIQCVSDMSWQRKNFLSKREAPEEFCFRFLNAKGISEDLLELKNIQWRYKGLDAVDIFAQVFGSGKADQSEGKVKKYYGLADLWVEDSINNIYRLTLVLQNKEISIPVEPVFASRASAKSFAWKWKHYRALEAKRTESLEAVYARFQRDSAQYMERNNPAGAMRYAMQTVALRTFTVDGFGVWNCDRQFQPERSNLVTASFVDEDGKPVEIRNGYLVEKNRNSVYTIDNPSSFRFDPKHRNLFWAILPGNKLAVVTPEEFDKHKKTKSGSACFVMKVSNDAFASRKKLDEALSFN